ncbi:hypothetical protein D1872_305410 [compost metagenome]
MYSVPVVRIVGIQSHADFPIIRHAVVVTISQRGYGFLEFEVSSDFFLRIDVLPGAVFDVVHDSGIDGIPAG